MSLHQLFHDYDQTVEVVIGLFSALSILISVIKPCNTICSCYINLHPLISKLGAPPMPIPTVSNTSVLGLECPVRAEAKVIGV